MTFWRAQERAGESGGKLVLRVDDLDGDRCRPEFRGAIMDDLYWFGLRWDEGPDVDGSFGPYVQSERREIYLAVWKRLRDAALIYPCTCSRRDVVAFLLAWLINDLFVAVILGLYRTRYYLA